MSTEAQVSIDTKVYTTSDGNAVIEQSTGGVVVLSAEQILTVIRELHACYDYCAAWKEEAQNRDPRQSSSSP